MSEELLEYADEVVEDMAESIANKVSDKTDGDVVHVIRSEKNQFFNSRYAISRDYGEYKLEQGRSVPVKEGIKSNVLYVYQLITEADLRHMVVYGAYEDGAITEAEKEELLSTSKRALRKFVKYKEEIKSDEHHKRDMVDIFNRIREELQEEGIIK